MEKLTPHICQSPEWGDFKTKMGTPAIRVGEMQFTAHRLPKTPYFIGYAPKIEPEKIDFPALYQAGGDHRCLFIKVEPHALLGNYQLPTCLAGRQATNYQLVASRPVFAPQTILLDLTKNKESLLSSMHPKTRYNIGLAQRKGVRVEVSEKEKDLEEFLRLQKETARRQGFFLHPDNYYRTCFEILHPKSMAYLLVAQIPAQLPVTSVAAWMLFRYKETLYYPYGGSRYQYRHLMASNLLMWEAIKLGQSLGCSVFDLWGACDDPADPWYGFTKFKLGFGGRLAAFAPAFDLVINPLIYPLVGAADRFRWLILNTQKRLWGKR